MSEFYKRSFFEKETCENITNFIYLPTEDDDYAKCVGDALRKCIYEDIILFEHRVSTVEEESKFSECMKGTGKRVVAGDAEYFEAIHEKEPVVVDTDIFYE